MIRGLTPRGSPQGSDDTLKRLVKYPAVESQLEVTVTEEAKAERRVGADAVQSTSGNVGNLIDGV